MGRARFSRASATSGAFVLIALTAALLVPAAAQQPDTDIVACRDAQNADAKIAGCTKVLARKGIATYPDVHATHLNNRGVGHFSKGDFKSAIADYDAAIKLHNKNPVFFANRGSAYAKLDDYKRAIGDFTESLRLRPNEDEILFKRGGAYRTTGDYQRAIDDYTQSIGLDPKFALTYTYRGFCYEQIKDVDAALKDYNQAIALNPKDASAINNRGVLSVRKGDYASAIRDYNEALRLEPTRPFTLKNRGHAHRENGDLDQALIDLNESIKQYPAVADAYVQRGIVLARLGRDTEAIADMRKALAVDPTYSAATDYIVRIEAKSGDVKSGGVKSGDAPPDEVKSSALKSEPQKPAAATAPEKSLERRVALVIGNGNYEFSSKLVNPANDAADMTKALRDLGFDVVEGRDLSHSKMQDTVRDFSRKLEGATIAVLFYAGHSLQVNGKNFLIPIDARIERQADLGFTTMDLAQVIGVMDAERRVNLVFLDACRDNPLSRSLAQSATGSTRSSHVRQGLAAIQSAAGTLIAFSTQPDNVALDGTGRNSPFTAALLKHLPTPGLEIETMMKQVRVDVIAATQEKQVPWGHSSLVGNVYLRSN